MDITADNGYYKSKFYIFCAFPMHDISIEEVEKRAQELFEKAVAKHKERIKVETPMGCCRPKSLVELSEYVLLDQIHKENVPEEAGRLWYLGDSIQLLDKADLVVFGNDWKDAKGCNVEMEACKQYDIPILIEGIDFV